MGKFGLLLLGCFFVTMAFVPLVSWGVTMAIVNLDASNATKLIMPGMKQLVSFNLLYTLELAAGLFCIKKGLSCG